jgi:DNA-directed RNA polymerase
VLDFRGRLNVAGHRGSHPQSSDLGKALLQFARGKPLGASGLYWLMVRAANAYGHDKVPLDERVAWTERHSTDITASANDPLGCGRLWNEAAEPWAFLATCQELADAWASKRPVDYVSHLPVPLDASANGLQHLSALARDPEGGLLTNLTPTRERHDVYEHVADVLRHRVHRDVTAGRTEAGAVLALISRALVKQPVMTTPYGVTRAGVRDQLNDALPASFGNELGHRARLLNYLRDAVIDAIGDTLSAAEAVMKWFAVIAGMLAAEGRPMCWTTPTGSRVRQGYLERGNRRVVTPFGTLLLPRAQGEGAPLGFDARRAAQSASANVVHSFDGAHLHEIVARLADIGVHSLTTVHDSFGTHAADTPLLGRVVRETFAAIHRTDHLARLADDWSLQLGRAVPEPPPRGTLDVSGVLSSQFAFA